VDSLNRLLGKLEQSDAPTIEDGEVGKKNKSFDALVSFQLIQGLQPREIWCPTCGNEFVPFKIISPDKGFSLCSQDENASRDYQDPRTFKQWRLNTPRFVSLLQKSLGIEGDAPKETLSRLLWDLGFYQTPTQKTHLFFVLDTARLGENGKAVLAQVESCFLIYAGTMKDLTLKDFVSVPLNELVVGIGKKGLALNDALLNKHFPKTALVDSDGDIELDADILLTKDSHLFLHKKKAGDYKDKKKVTPQAASIIRFLYQVRNYSGSNAETLGELARRFTKNQKSTVSISNNIKKIEDLCKKNKVKPILHKDSNDKWGLNKNLDCCK
jgi:hypothetical protein